MLSTIVGESRLKLDDGQEVMIGPVYWVPESRVNLFSIGSALGHGWKMRMEEGGGVLRHSKGPLTLSKTERLWTIPIIPKHNIYHLNIMKSKLEEEHQRLGHMGKSGLMVLAKKGELKYTWTELKDDGFQLTDCNTCQAWKAVRPPKNNDVRRSMIPLGIIHIDLTGPFQPSLRGYNWLMVIVDDYTNAVEAKPINAKDVSFGVLVKVVRMWERQFEKEVKVIRSDGDSVFDSGAARAWYDQHGIRHHITPRYTPESNGKAERTIRTLKDGIRAMINSSGLGHGFWDYAVEYYAVILNKMSTYDNKNVWQTLTGRHPNIKSIRTFGEYGYVHIPSEIRRKASFETMQAERCRILGQDPNVSGYLVIRERDGRVIRSRDVKPLTGPITPAARILDIEIPVDDEITEGSVALGPQQRKSSTRCPGMVFPPPT